MTNFKVGEVVEFHEIQAIQDGDGNHLIAVAKGLAPDGMEMKSIYLMRGYGLRKVGDNMFGNEIYELIRKA